MEEDQKRIAQLRDSYRLALIALLQADPGMWGWALETLYLTEVYPIAEPASAA